MWSSFSFFSKIEEQGLAVTSKMCSGQYFRVISIFLCAAAAIGADEKYENDIKLDIPDPELPHLKNMWFPMTPAMHSGKSVWRVARFTLMQWGFNRYYFDDGSIASEAAKFEKPDKDGLGFGDGYFRFNIRRKILEFKYQAKADGIQGVLSKFRWIFGASRFSWKSSHYSNCHIQRDNNRGKLP